ncbi:hypothetical protein ACLESO_17005, partial [Pyxidicoccus sp. 3LG]
MRSGLSWFVGLLFLVAGCATVPVPTPPPPPTLPAPPRPLLKAYRLLPDGTPPEAGLLPPGDTGFQPPTEGDWYAEPLEPVRTEDAARALSAVLREYRVPGLAFGDVGLPAPALLTTLLEGTTVRSLQVSGTDFGNAHVAALRGATGLEALHLDGTRVGDAGLVHLQGLTRLALLRLDETAVVRPGPWLPPPGLTCLRRRHAPRAPAVSSRGLGLLAAQAELEWLDLSDTTVDDTVLASIPGARLRTLILSGTRVTDAG